MRTSANLGRDEIRDCGDSGDCGEVQSVAPSVKEERFGSHLSCVGFIQPRIGLLDEISYGDINGYNKKNSGETGYREYYN